MKAVQCPVCNGTGLKAVIPVTEKCETLPCHGCNGKGWVEVGDQEIRHEYIPPRHGYLPYDTWGGWYPPPNPMATSGTACGQCGKPF